MVAILQIMSVDWPRTSNSDADKCIIILKSVQHHESLHECKVAISKVTLHFRKVTKDFKQESRRRLRHGKTVAGRINKQKRQLCTGHQTQLHDYDVKN